MAFASGWNQHQHNNLIVSQQATCLNEIGCVPNIRPWVGFLSSAQTRNRTGRRHLSSPPGSGAYWSSLTDTGKSPSLPTGSLDCQCRVLPLSNDDLDPGLHRSTAGNRIRAPPTVPGRCKPDDLASILTDGQISLQQGQKIDPNRTIRRTVAIASPR